MATVAIPLLLSAFGGLAGLLGGKPKVQETKGTSTTDSTASQNATGFSTTTPELSLIQQLLSNIAGTAAIDQFNKGPQDFAGFESSGLQQLNQAGDIKKKLSQNILASRGLSSSPYAAFAESQPENERVSAQSQFLAGIPLLQHQFQQGNIDQLIKAFGATGPFGSSTATAGQTDSTGHSTTNQTATSTQPGNPLAGLFGGLGSGLAAGLPLMFPNLYKGSNP